MTTAARACLRAGAIAWLAGLCALSAAPALRAQTEAAAPAPRAAERIEQLEILGRGQPLEAAAGLEELLPRLEPFTPDRLEALTVRGLLLAAASQKAAAEAIAGDLDRWARARNAPEASAAATLVRARVVSQGSALKRADRLFGEALARLPETAPAAQRYRAAVLAARVKEGLGQLDEAVRLGQVAQQIADAGGTPWRRAEARTTLAYTYHQARQVERARVLNDEAIVLAEAAGDWHALGRAHNVASILLDGAGDPAAELRHMQLAIEHARRGGSRADEGLYLANLADHYLQTGDYATALELAEKALPIARELKDPTGESVALANIGLAHISLQRIELGKRFLGEAIALDEQRGSLTGMALFQGELGKYLERAGDLAGAVEAYHQHRRLADEILQRDQQDAILALQEQFDADRREREIQLLNRENEVQAEQLRRVELQQRLWWLLAASAVLSVAVLALMARRVRQDNQRLASVNRALKVQSERDPLTGLSNRRHVQAALGQRAPGERFAGSLFLIDVDHFKRINDSHGHGAGDAVLVEVARRLAQTLREQDMIVRWGGEEFLVVVRGQAPEAADPLAQRLLAALSAEPVRHEGREIEITGSIGYASFPMAPAGVAVSWEGAVNLVDTAMYLAKAHGRNRAYGVRRLHVDDEAGVERIARSLEAAWREGRVELNLVHAGQVREAAA